MFLLQVICGALAAACSGHLRDKVLFTRESACTLAVRSWYEMASQQSDLSWDGSGCPGFCRALIPVEEFSEMPLLLLLGHVMLG